MEQKELSLRDLHASFEYNRTALEKAVTKLEKEAGDITAKLDQRKAAQGRIAAAQREIASLKGTKSDLYLDWQKADFDDDQEARKELKNKRKEIDERISELEGDIDAEREAMPTVYSKHAAETAVQVDMLKPLDLADFMGKLRAMLDEQAGELNARIRAMKIPPSAYKSEDYKTIRAGRDSKYATQLANEKRLYDEAAPARAMAEANRKHAENPSLPSVSSTDMMHTIQGRGKKPSADRMSVTASGQKVKTYSELGVSSDEDADRAHVLSGDEVRAALAAKQAKKAS